MTIQKFYEHVRDDVIDSDRCYPRPKTLNTQAVKILLLKNGLGRMARNLAAKKTGSGEKNGNPFSENWYISAYTHDYVVKRRWLLHKTVYKFQESFLKELMDTETEEIHPECLKNIPFSEFAIDCEGKFENKNFPFLVGLERENDKFGITMACFGETNNLHFDLYSGKTIAESVESQLNLENASEGILKDVKSVISDISYVINLCYYVASLGADVKECDEDIQKEPSAKHTTGTKQKTASAKILKVGYIVGSELEKMYRDSSYTPNKEERHGAMGSSKRPHMRRAHWHHYRTKAGLIVKWLPPIFVNANSDTAEDTVSIISHASSAKSPLYNKV